MSGATFDYFATCASGHEPLLHAEIRALKLANVERQVGGVRFSGDARDAWRANLWLRTAIRVLRRVARFPCANERELDEGVATVDWSLFVKPDGKLRVDAHSNQSALEHTLYLEQRTKDTICDGLRARFGTRPSVDLEDPDLGVHVHLVKDRCTLLVDTSGDSLHKRGWRKHQGRAPLAETTAAALVLASGWDRRSPLVDPFCGSGTILVEAALIAANACPGRYRKSFGFARWPGHDDAAWQAFREREVGVLEWPKKLVLRGCDVDRERISDTRENAEAAGFGDRIEVETGRAEDFAWKRGWNAWIVTNPPWGERVADARRADDTLARFGERLKESCAGYHASVLVGNPRLERALGLPVASRLAWKSGGIDAQVLQIEL